MNAEDTLINPPCVGPVCYAWVIDGFALIWYDSSIELGTNPIESVFLGVVMRWVVKGCKKEKMPRRTRL